MNDLIKAIHSAQDLEKKVEYYFTMTGGEKLSLLQDLRKQKDEHIGIFLNAIYPEETDREIRKLIRKAIFHLRSSGVKVEEPRSQDQPVLRKVEEVRANRGFLTNFDYSRSRTVMAAYEVKKNTFVFLNGEVHFREGLRELMSSPVDRKDLEKIVEAYRTNTREPAFMGEISSAYAAYIVEEGSKLSGRFNDAIRSLKSFVAHLKDAVHRPEDIYSLPAAEGVAPLAPQDVLRHSIFVPFSLSWERIEEDRKEYLSPGTSAIVLPQHMVEEKRAAFLKGLIGRDSIRSQMPLVKRMLEDYAYFFHGMGDITRYLGTIAILRDDNAIADVLLYFLKKSLRPGEEKPDEGGLIVTPHG